MIALDLRAAFDTVSVNKLLITTDRLDMEPVVKRCLRSYLHGRQATVEFKNSQSKARSVVLGVP